MIADNAPGAKSSAYGGTTDIHLHLGGAVPAPVLWEIAQDQGLAVPHTSFGEFQKALSSAGVKHRNLDDFLGKYFHVTEEIQSSPQAIATSIYQTVAKSHRRGGTTLMEIRFNPAKRLRGGIHSMDTILLSACQGIERAILHYHTRAGIILSLGRDCTTATNVTIVEAAIRWHNIRPELVVGIDVAGPESGRMESDKDWLANTSRLFLLAKSHGLKTTYHVGETGYTGWRGVRRILEYIRPDRIGHGIELRNAPVAERLRIMETLAATETCLEICPSVNLATRSIPDIGTLRRFVSELFKARVPFATCTDNPYLVHTNPLRELDVLLPARESDIRKWSVLCGSKYSFLPAS